MFAATDRGLAGDHSLTPASPNWCAFLQHKLPGWQTPSQFDIRAKTDACDMVAPKTRENGFPTVWGSLKTLRKAVGTVSVQALALLVVAHAVIEEHLTPCLSAACEFSTNA